MALCAAIGWWFVPRRADVVRQLFVVFAFSVVASFPILVSVWRFNAFSPFNDTFTYLEHAQWLQQHAFREPALISGSHPAFTQIALYQLLGDRMGASYFLGWMQAAGAFDWSFRVYPAVAGSLLTVAGLSIAGAVHFFVGRRRIVALAIGALSVTMPAGLRFGSIYGFLPQTAGLAMMVSAFILFAAWLCALRRNRSAIHPKYFLTAAITLAAGIVCYFALLPFVAISLAGTASLAAWRLGVHRWHQLVGGLAAFIAILLLLMHVEIVRAYHAIVYAISANVGTPVSWGLIDFCGHALGVHGGAWEGGKMIPGAPWLAVSAAICFCLLGLRSLSRSAVRVSLLLPILIFLAISTVAFIKFRYFTPPPPGWPRGSGSSWSAFKVCEWASPFFSILWGIGVARFLIQAWMPRWLGLGALAAMLATTLTYNYTEADPATRAFRSAVNSEDRPFETLLSFRQYLEQYERGAVLQLDLPLQEQKLRQMLIYFLRDFQLAGDWTDDSYLSPMLPAAERVVRVAQTPASTRRVFVADGRPQESRANFGRFRIGPPGEHADIYEVISDYGRESGPDGWWYWVKNEISFHCRIDHIQARQLRIAVALNRGNPTDEVRYTVRLPQAAPLEHSIVFDSEGKVAPLPLIDLPPDVKQLEITFRCGRSPGPISPQDTRQVTFLLKNLELTLVDDS